MNRINKLETLTLLIAIINWSVLILGAVILGICFFLDTSHPFNQSLIVNGILSILFVLFFLSIFTSFINEVIIIMLVIKRRTDRKKLILILIGNSIYFVVYLLFLRVFMFIGVSV